jgi:hypothetical protein
MGRSFPAAFVCIVALVAVPTALANHPVFVEGNCLNPPAGNPGPVTAGTCGDYDGDGRIGTAEDGDGDRVFGTITAALSGGTGANQNGSVTIVTSGVFAEVVSITAANGNVTLQAAPGVEANIDAVLQGDPNSGARQNAPGVVVNAPADRRVTIRNIMSRNWTEGFSILGNSHVTLDGVRAENNTNWGVRVRDRARVAISNSAVQATGFRVGATGNFPTANQPQPGAGIEFQGGSSGTVCFSTVAGNFRAGIAGDEITVSHNNVFDNSPNLDDVNLEDDCQDKDRHSSRSSSGLTGPAVAFGFGLLAVGLVFVRLRRRLT